MAGNRDFKLGILKGKDSACGSIVGPVSSFRLGDNVDFMLGGYNANLKTFEKRGMIPPNFAGITPVVGFNFKLPLVKTETFEINLNNLVSVGIITHALSVDF